MDAVRAFIFLVLTNSATVFSAPVYASHLSEEEGTIWPGGDSQLSNETFNQAKGFLTRYFGDSSAEMPTSNFRKLVKTSLRNKLEKMQEFFGLKVTGKLDKTTLDVMKKPRCGVPDISRYGHFYGQPKWGKTDITYRITQYTTDLNKRDVDTAIAQAFKLYSDVIPLNFIQIYSGIADIMILFKAGAHGDFFPFDGPYGTLAHANSPGPSEGGDTHFDEDETWTLSPRGINLLLVAAHEFGHALGLDHSRDPSALMYPTYQYVDTRGYQLPRDDRLGVQALYGSRQPNRPEPARPTEKPKPQPNPKPNPNPGDPASTVPAVPEQCNRDLVFDAATSIRKELYFFKNGYFWKKSTLFNGIQLNTVKSVWPQINVVDAAYEVPFKDTTFLFQGHQYWATRGYYSLSGYPKEIYDLGFPHSVRKIDAAVYVADIKRTLFFVRSRYWSYNEEKRTMDRGYPKHIKQDFPGIEGKIDSAFENYGFLYFSNGPRQSEYDYKRQKVVRVLLNYGWLDCY
uniref:Matrix metallopeptidase 30 n=2 Tax=Erpetoichthys calabaricus TaxID=27687 RepID=A0A8C4S1J2_ERPCA